MIPSQTADIIAAVCERPILTQLLCCKGSVSEGLCLHKYWLHYVVPFYPMLPHPCFNINRSTNCNVRSSVERWREIKVIITEDHGSPFRIISNVLSSMIMKVNISQVYTLTVSTELVSITLFTNSQFHQHVSVSPKNHGTWNFGEAIDLLSHPDKKSSK